MCKGKNLVKVNDGASVRKSPKISIQGTSFLGRVGTRSISFPRLHTILASVPWIGEYGKAPLAPKRCTAGREGSRLPAGRAGGHQQRHLPASRWLLVDMVDMMNFFGGPWLPWMRPKLVDHESPKPQWSEPREYCPLSLATSPWLVKCGSGSGRAVEAVEQSIELSLAAATHYIIRPRVLRCINHLWIQHGFHSFVQKIPRGFYKEFERGTEYRVRSRKGSSWGLLESPMGLHYGVTE